MHELSITRQILDIAVERAKEVHAGRVSRINLTIGEKSSLIDDCIQFYFNFISQDSIAEGARLSFRRIPLKVKCRPCGHEFSPVREPWICPRCGNWDIEITGGNEFYVDSIEVEE